MGVHRTAPGHGAGGGRMNARIRQRAVPPLRLVVARMEPFPSWAPADVGGLWRETARTSDDLELSRGVRGSWLAGFVPADHAERADHHASQLEHRERLPKTGARRLD